MLIHGVLFFSTGTPLRRPGAGTPFRRPGAGTPLRHDPGATGSNMTPHRLGNTMRRADTTPTSRNAMPRCADTPRQLQTSESCFARKAAKGTQSFLPGGRYFAAYENE